jgi:MobC-like protein
VSHLILSTPSEVGVEGSAPSEVGVEQSAASEVGRGKYWASGPSKTRNTKNRTTMKKEKELRDKWVNTRYSKSELETLQKLFKQTACKDLGDYIRKVTLNKPVSIRYRNQSVDDFLAEMVSLKRELNAIGTNFNQAVHRLHNLQFVPDIQHWVMMNETDKTQLFRLIESINNRVNQLYQLWSHE